jgi:hypothetical protein
MKLQDLQKTAAVAKQKLRETALKAAEAVLKARAAKVVSSNSKQGFKLARKAAKLAKKLATKAEARAAEQGRVFAKAEKRLAKALKKAGRRMRMPKREPAGSKLKTSRPAPAKSVSANGHKRKPGAARPVTPIPKREATPLVAAAIPTAPPPAAA